MIDTKSDGRGLARRGAPWLAVLSAFALAACSSTPDWANPVEWYMGATSVFEDEPAPTPANDAAAEMANTPIPGEGEAFPNLATVPARPRSVTPADERKKITAGLVSDRANARYVEEPAPTTRATLVPGAEVTASPRPPVSSGPAEPPPPPTPTPPVSSGPAELPPPQPAPPPTPTPSSSPPPPAAAPSPPAPAPAASQPPPPANVAPRPAPEAAEPDASRSLGSLVVGPGGEIKSAQAGNGSASPTSSSRVGHIPGTYPMAVVLFNDGSTQISEPQRQGLGAVVKEANARGANIRVVGHASPPRNANSTGSLVNNFHTSMVRAQSVASALIRLGMPPDRVHVEADTSPDSIPDVANVPAGDAGLRRADIFLE
jgi:outer membrane protein OmpA-like peptidoglycan-associated protein